jgi:hypothetical protein
MAPTEQVWDSMLCLAARTVVPSSFGTTHGAVALSSSTANPNPPEVETPPTAPQFPGEAHETEETNSNPPGKCGALTPRAQRPAISVKRKPW